ncbi:hypothetical protein ACFL3G_09545 [Planctomycetota bacterium]
METENKQINRANWSNQQQAFTLIIIPIETGRFSRLGLPAYIPGETLFQADLFSIS